MAPLGELGKSMAFPSCSHGLCFLSSLERRESSSSEASGMSGVGEKTLTRKLDYPTRLGVSEIVAVRPVPRT